MNETYIHQITKHFYELPFENLRAETVHQVRRSLLDYLGCTISSVKLQCADGLVKTFLSLGAAGNSRPWGYQGSISAAAAGAANAGRASAIELDDTSGRLANASVHPGVYVWTAAIEAYKEHPCDFETLSKAVIFGYDICIRFGMLCSESVRTLGLHGPGLCGSFGATAAAAMIMGLSQEETENAICIAGTLLPVSPFVSFTEGSTAKDLYGAWGVYLAFTAIVSAQNGLLGPVRLLEGDKGLNRIFDLKRGMDAPMGSPYWIDDISFKEYSACASVHPALNALIALMQEEGLESDKVEKITVETYPYSYALSIGSETCGLSPVSARVSLPFCVAFAAHEGKLTPDAFTEENLHSGEYLSFMEKVEVLNHEEYGEGNTGVRGSIVTITMKDGSVYSREKIRARWSAGVSDHELREKFRAVTAGALSGKGLAQMENDTMTLDGTHKFDEILRLLGKL